MLLSNVLSPRTVKLRLSASSKEDLLDRMIDLFDGHAAVTDLGEVRRVVHEREAQMSTGVGKGVALPHGKTSAVKSIVAAMAVTATPIDFDALDGEAINVVFMIIGPTSAQSDHVKLLSRISLLMNRSDVRLQLMGAETEDEALELIASFEQLLLED